MIHGPYAEFGVEEDVSGIPSVWIRVSELSHLYSQTY